MTTKQPTNNRQKRTNSRPCDACAVRRVRCDLQSSLNYRCTNCANHNIECTNIRIRHKSGPKKIKDKTRENINNLINGSANGTIDISGPNQAMFPVQMPYQPPNGFDVNDGNDAPYHKLARLNYSVPNQPYCLNQLLPYLQIYQTWFYGIWPVLSVANLITKLSTPEEHHTAASAADYNGQAPSMTFFSNTDPITLNETNAPSYALCCALNATIARHKVFLKSTSTVINLVNCPTSKEFADEAIRVFYLFDLRAKPSIETLLTSLFLHIFYSNCPNQEVRGLMYLREAVTIGHILKFHDPEYVLSRPSAESHRIKKIYYLLIMVERFFSLENQYSPVLLDACIPIPNLNDEEYPDILHGFIEINRVFAATDKQFFQEISQQNSGSRSLFSLSGNTASDSIANLKEFFNHQPTMSLDDKKQWIQRLQSKLSIHSAEFSQIQNDTQRVNILLSKAWFKSLGWLISSQNYLINNYSTEDCFAMKFPLKIANEFLSATSQSSDFAFEQNGPGVAYKLLEIANSVYTFTLVSDETTLAFDQLNTLHHMIMKFKVDMEISNPILQKVTDALEFRRFGTYRQLEPVSIDKNNNTDKLYEIGPVDENELEEEPLMMNTDSTNKTSSRSDSSSSIESVLDDNDPITNEVNSLLQSSSGTSYSTTNLANLINYPSSGATPGFSPAVNNLLSGDSFNSNTDQSITTGNNNNNNRGLGFYLSPFLQGFNGN